MQLTNFEASLQSFRACADLELGVYGRNRSSGPLPQIVVDFPPVAVFPLPQPGIPVVGRRGGLFQWFLVEARAVSASTCPVRSRADGAGPCQPQVRKTRRRRVHWLSVTSHRRPDDGLEEYR